MTRWTRATEEAPVDEREIQKQELQRVRSRLADAVLAFCAKRGVGSTFHLTDLLAHIRTQGDLGAPDSPSRILRDLRQRNLLAYTVVNRRASAYRLDWLKGVQGKLF